MRHCRLRTHRSVRAMLASNLRKNGGLTRECRSAAEGETTMATTKHAAVPSLIKAVRIAQYGGSEQLKYEEAPLPEIGPGHVLAKVRYAGVNPVDWRIREGFMKQVLPLTLGQDFAGEIVTGGDSGGFRTGERVFGFGVGTYAEFTAAAIADIAAIPEKIEFAVAAALPTAGLTALQAIRDYVQPTPGTRILIHGAAGAVGSFATQIAKRWGAQVIGTASGEDIVYLRSLGHVQVVDYKQERFETVGPMDAVLDLIGGETATRSFALVKKGGVMVSTVGGANAELAAQAGIRGVNMVIKRSAADLSELAGLVERGDVKSRMGEVFRLEQARAAQDASQQGRAKGKILLRVT
jgi:NADPH:quinone reductase-like Zn-dependent oxidoreductase